MGVGKNGRSVVGIIVNKLKKENNIVVFQDGEIELKVSVEKDSIWLKAEDIATLFEVNRPAIVKIFLL